MSETPTRPGVESAETRLEAERVRARLVEDLRAVTELAIELGAARTPPQLYETIAAKLCSVANAAFVAVSSFRPQECALVVESVAVSPGLGLGLADLEGLLGGQVIGLRMPLDPQTVALLARDFVASFTSLREVCFGAIPEAASEAIRHALDLGELHAIAFADERGPLATCTMAMRRGAPPPSEELRSAFARVGTVAVSRVLAESALRESEARFATTFRSSPLSTAITLLEDGHILDVNEAWVRLTGFAADEAVGQTTEALGLWVDPRQRAQLLEHARSGKALGSGEMQLRRRSGEIRDLLMSAEPIDVAGRSCMLSMALDITERKRAERALHESRERFRAVFEGVSDGILLAAIDASRFVMANPAICAMLGYSDEELLRLGPRDIHPPESWPTVLENFRRHAAGERSLSPGTLLRRKDGETLMAEVNAVPIELGGARYLLGVFRDMTAFVEMESQLRQSQKMEAIGQLAGGVAHDFNNLLCVIQGHCERMLRSLREDDPLSRHVRQVQESSDKAAALTRQLLAFSRKQPLHPEVLDLNATVLNLQGMLVRLIGEDIDLDTRLAADLRPTRADPGQIEQVVVNLSVNARDAMPQGGQLLIETANVTLSATDKAEGLSLPPGEYVVLRVSDSGTGMDAQTRERIFEPFFTTKEKGRGTGLGLSTVYGIATQSGGCVRVESEPGRGSRFEVFLPQTAEAVGATVRPVDVSPQPGHDEWLLVVEDERAMRDMLREALETLGYRVRLAANGGEALIAVEEERMEPDLLVTDIVMPGMSGVVLAERLRRSRPGLRVLFMSGYADERVRQTLPAGSPLLEKPFGTADLAASVSAALAGMASAPPGPEAE